MTEIKLSYRITGARKIICFENVFKNVARYCNGALGYSIACVPLDTVSSHFERVATVVHKRGICILLFVK